jgi:hypothetical protein
MNTNWIFWLNPHIYSTLGFLGFWLITNILSNALVYFCYYQSSTILGDYFTLLRTVEQSWLKKNLTILDDNFVLLRAIKQLCLEESPTIICYLLVLCCKYLLAESSCINFFLYIKIYILLVNFNSLYFLFIFYFLLLCFSNFIPIFIFIYFLYPFPLVVVAV